MTSTYWLLALLGVATAFGVWRKATEGRARVDSHHELVSSHDIGHELGERATLLQFSSAFCSPCRTTKIVLAKTAAAVPGVEHIEIDAESHLELVRRLEIRKTPTTLILDAQGRVQNRAVGVPRQEDLLAVIATVVTT
jgi:thiol-disulfide isomerase/thioredoxin